MHKERFPGSPTAHSGTHPVEVGDAVCPTRNAFPVNRDGRYSQGGKRFGYAWHPVSPVMPAPAEDAHAVKLAAAYEPEAVVLDLIGPL
jgi:hypothetical protein